MALRAELKQAGLRVVLPNIARLFAHSCASPRVIFGTFLLENRRRRLTNAARRRFVVRTAGVEPAWAFARGILSPLRLPVSPRPPGQSALLSHFAAKMNLQPA